MGECTRKYLGNTIFETKEEALDVANGEGIACIHVSFTVGEGLE